MTSTTQQQLYSVKDYLECETIISCGVEIAIADLYDNGT